jgi:general secretion pathway protein L
MPEVLVLRLQGTPDTHQAEWMVVDTTGARLGAVSQGSLAEFAAQTLDKRVVVLIPGTDVLLAEPVLPAKGGSKLAQLVPYALEEQLASDVEDLHFAIGRREPPRPGTPVAVIANARLDAWLGALKTAGIHPDALHGETAGLPSSANGVTLLIDGNRVYVKREDKPGAVIDVEPLIEGLQLALDSGAEAHEHVTLFVTETDYERERDLLEGLREFTASLQLKLLPEGALPLLASTSMRTTPINLLQGKYTIASPIKASLAPWRYVAGLAAVFLLTHIAYKAVQYTQVTRQEAELDAAIQQVYQAAMPGAPKPDPDEARSQMEARLTAIRGATVTGGFLGALDTVSSAIQQVPDAQLESLSYRANTTDLRIVAPNVDALDRIRQSVAAKGANAEIQSANPRENVVEGRLQLRTAGA